MPKKKAVSPAEGSFGERLTALRQTAGLSQRQLAQACGVSQRMIAYYEGRAPLPPGHVLSAVAEALAITVDELVGKKKAASAQKRSRISQRLLRRLVQMEKLPLREKKELLAIIDTYLEKNRLSQQRIG